MSAQDETIRQYHELMKLNAIAHILRASRRVGVFDELRKAQRTAAELCEALTLDPKPTALLLDALVATGVVERYQDDYAISQAARLLCQYDEDLGDARWETLQADLRAGHRPAPVLQNRFDAIAATQWVHTSAAMQAAEILDVGGDDGPQGVKILDLGCGSAVWSCAMAFRDPAAHVTAIDHAAALEAAQSMADSIELGSRFETINADPCDVDLPANSFDLTVIAQRLHALGDDQGDQLLDRAVAATKPAGQVVVIDLYQSPADLPVAQAIAALRLQLDTPAGRIPTLEQTKSRFERAGLDNVQFTFLAASRDGLGMTVGRKPSA